MPALRRAARLAGAALLLATSACSWSKTVVNEPDFLTRADQVVVGQTRREQLPEILGSTPLTWIQAADGTDIYVYTYGQTKAKAFNMILLGISKANTRIDSAWFVIDKDGLVSKKFVGTNSQDVPFEWWAFGDD